MPGNYYCISSLKFVNSCPTKRNTETTPELRPDLEGRTWWKEFPTGSNKGGNSFKMSLS